MTTEKTNKNLLSKKKRVLIKFVCSIALNAADSWSKIGIGNFYLFVERMSKIEE